MPGAGTTPHPVTRLGPPLIMVAKTDAGVPTCTERLLGSTAATSGLLACRAKLTSPAAFPELKSISTLAPATVTAAVPVPTKPPPNAVTVKLPGLTGIDQPPAGFVSTLATPLLTVTPPRPSPRS